MAITDPAAIQYSNEKFRPAADRLYRCYAKLWDLNNRWLPAGDNNDERAAGLATFIEGAAKLIENTFFFLRRANLLWDAHTLVPLFPNDPAEMIEDGSPGDGRKPISGQEVRRLKNRMEEFVGWLERGTDLDNQFANEATQILPVTNDNLFDFLRMTGEAKVPTTGWAVRVAVALAGQLLTEYEVTNPAFPAQILAVAVNPGTQVE